MVLISLAIAAAILAMLFFIGKIPISYNLRNLTLRWRTTLMTALAFTAVVALLTVMMAFVHGMRRLTEDTGQPGNVIVLADGATDEIISNLTIGDLSEIENLPDVLRENGRPMSSRETCLVANQPIPSTADGRPKRRFLQVRGIEDPVLTAKIHGLDLLPGGSWFSEAGVQESAPPQSTPHAPREAAPSDPHSNSAPLVQAVLGEGVAYELGRSRTSQERAAAKNPKRLDVGDTFTLGNRQWIIVGILKSSGSTFNSEIWAKRSLAAALFGKDTYTTLVLRTENAETAQNLKNFLSEDYKKAAVNAQVETEYYKSLSETTAQFSWAIGFIAFVMSIGGVFGVMNTMFAAISQRTGDIGVLRLLGFARWHVLVAFLLESLTIGLLGGLLGCALGSMADGWNATSIVGGTHGGGKSVVLQLAISPDIIAGGILLTLAMALLGGLLPAISAMRLKPLEALR
jgi:ABC-type lipoprotein release transport system permease subunit